MNYFAKMAEIRNNKKGGKSMFKWFKKLINSEEGATAVEYALIAAGVALAIVAIIPELRNAIGNIFQDIINALTPAE